MVRQNLIELRGNKTQKQISEQLNISQDYLSKIELGLRNPSIRVIKRFQRVYKRSMKTLFPDIFLHENTPKWS